MSMQGVHQEGDHRHDGVPDIRDAGARAGAARGRDPLAPAASGPAAGSLGYRPENWSGQVSTPVMMRRGGLSEHELSRTNALQ